jgi:DHA3 family macrolide efflux protein-like MFS transporter
MGSQLVQFALIWWLTQQTGSATVLAIASIVGLVPQVVLGPFVGPLIDRWNRKWTMILSDAFVALSTLGLAYLFWTGAAEPWHVYVALFIRALGGAFHWPAMTASTSLMVPPGQLTRIQGLNQILNGGLSIAAAPLGALLISLWPVQQVLLVDIVTAVIAMLTISIVKVPQPAPDSSQEAGTTAAYVRDLKQGLRYVLNWRGLLMLGGLAMLINLVLSPVNAFMPLLVTEHFAGTAWHLGILEAGFGVGVLIGGLLLGIWGGFKRRIDTSLLGVAGIGIGILLVGLAPASFFPLAMAGMFIVGVMNSMTNGPVMAIFQATVEPAMQGRVFALIGSTSAAMMPLGLALAGPLADVIGVRALIFIGGGVTLLAAFVGRLIPSLVNIEEDRQNHLAAVESAPTPAPPVSLTGESEPA